MLDGDRRHLTAARKALTNLDRFHGNAIGMFNGDEWLAGDSPSSGFELCAVVEFMFSLEQLTRVFGQREFSDRLEQTAFNALPAHFDARMTAHQYHQQVNQVLCNVAQRNWTLAFDDANTFGLSPHFGCCTANFHQGWPKFAGALWMHTADGGLAATAYAPNRVKVALAGVAISIKTQTDYPFKDSVRFKIRAGRALRFPLWLRIPAWCDAPEIACNGEVLDNTPNAAGYVRIDRTWQTNDEIILRLPLKLRAIPRPNGALALAAGALTLAFWPGEIWERIPGSAGFGDWEVRARNSWSFALAIDPTKLDQFQIELGDLPSPPFALQNPLENGVLRNAPLRVRVPMQLLTDWGMTANSAARPPASPIQSSRPIHMLHLVPYGCTRIRITEMPVAAGQKRKRRRARM